MGATGGFSLQVQDPSGGDFNKFAAVTQEFIAKARENPAIGAMDYQLSRERAAPVRQVDRERAKALGVPISEVFDTLQAFFGNLYINDFVKFGRVYRVQTEADAQYRSKPDDISKIYVRALHTEWTRSDDDSARHGGHHGIHERARSGHPFQWIQYRAGLGGGGAGV